MQKNQSKLLARSTSETVQHYLEKNQKAITASVPAGFNVHRMIRTAVNAVATTPELAECSAPSIFRAIVRSFSLGLEPNGALNEAYLVPFWNNKTKIKEAQFMPSYRGLMMLARRSNEVTLIYASEVCKNDYFKEIRGLAKNLIHEPEHDADRGDIIGYYAVIKYRNGDYDFEYMTVNEIDKVRNSSKAASSGPWTQWLEEMSKKTVIKRLLKRAPSSIELAQTIQADNKAAMGEGDDDYIDISGLEVPPEAELPPSRFERNTPPVPPPPREIEQVRVPAGADWLPAALGNAPVTADEVRAYAAKHNLDDNYLRDNLMSVINEILNA